MPLTVQSMELEALCFRLSVCLYPGQNHSLTSLPSTYSFHIIFHFWFSVDCLFGIKLNFFAAFDTLLIFTVILLNYNIHRIVSYPTVQQFHVFVSPVLWVNVQ